MYLCTYLLIDIVWFTVTTEDTVPPGLITTGITTVHVNLSISPGDCHVGMQADLFWISVSYQ